MYRYYLIGEDLLIIKVFINIVSIGLLCEIFEFFGNCIFEENIK